MVEFRVHLVRTLEAAASRAAADHDGLEQTPHKHRAVARRHYGNMVAAGFVNLRSNPTVRDLIENPEVALTRTGCCACADAPPSGQSGACAS